MEKRKQILNAQNMTMMMLRSFSCGLLNWVKISVIKKTTKNLEWKNLDKKYKEDYNTNSRSPSMATNAQQYIYQQYISDDDDKKTPEKETKYQKKQNVNLAPLPPPPVQPDAGTSVQPGPNPPSQPVNHTPGGNPPQSDQPINTDILNTTIPVGISVALGSIALLFYYMKKKPKITRPTDLFRVLEIPQKDHGMPTKISTNRYVPYTTKYRGKTYIYVEDTGDDTYIGNISSSDVTTTSSDSEVDEMDINDIYGYSGPKHKTLIDVVLKPTKSGNITISGDTPNSGIIPRIPSDIPTDKLTDNEWNELKDDFISNMLQTEHNDVVENSGNTFIDPQPNILDTNHYEKPFITQIQDRKLYSDNEVTYNINWNVPENTQIYTMDIPKYNSLYSGSDLINDSLNSGNDIYDELLKRKENELFGTKHTKNTSTNSDPISNQIDLFHKWLDRHRYMCEKWNNKEEMLSKLYDEWNKSNNEHVLYIPSNDNADDINTINDENYNMINANKHERNHKTSLEHLGSTNIPPNDLTTQNNGSQEKN
uniref:EMP1-like protein n=1 Tax=Plasmodium gaboni TaxID=647221 RepID=A0A0P0IH57_9APIC|nr:EMP1-like protein [Plasmodium gaboni]